MYINSQFQNNIILPSPHVAMRLTFDDEVISYDDNLISASLSFICDSFIGVLPSWKLNADIYYESYAKYNSRECFVEVGAFEETHTTVTWIPMGFFTVEQDGQTTNEIEKTISIVAYDRIAKLDTQYALIAFDSPLKGSEIADSILGQVGLTRAPGDELYFDEYLFESINVGEDEVISCREILRQYAEANLSMAYADRDGNVVFKSVVTSGIFEQGFSSNDYDNIEIEDDYGPINSLVLAYTDDGDGESYDDVASQDESSIDNHGICEFRIASNVFLFDRRESVIDSLFSFINGFTYSPFSVDVFSRPDFDPGDIVALSNMASEVRKAPVTNITLDYAGGMVGTMETKILPETLTEYQYAGNSASIQNVKLRVVKAERKIEANIQNTQQLESGLNEQIANWTLTQASIEQEIIDRQTGDEGVSEAMTSLVQQFVDQFNIQFGELSTNIDGVSNDVYAYFNFDASGLTIGKSDSQVKLKLGTDGVIYFLVNGETVAYIQNDKLYIENVEVLQTIILANHIFEKSTFSTGRTVIRGFSN